MQFALIGTTSSGKSDLALKLALKLNAIILSLDSLSVYKEIDIASAKPTKNELKKVKHFGVDEIYPNEIFNVTLFFDLYKKAKKEALQKNIPLIIVGGTSFYLKAMLSGLSDRPIISTENALKVSRVLRDLTSAYKKMVEIDPIMKEKIEQNDSYRIEKWYEIYFQTEEIPSHFLKRTMKKPIIKQIPVFEIETDKDILKERITKRTKNMIKNGLIDEVALLEKRYSREPNCMKAIGIKEVIDYFDGIYNIKELEEKIITNTAKLAKRQKTFNKTQFLDQNIVKKPLNELEDIILKNINV